MIFLGHTFCSGKHSLLYAATKITPTISLQIFDGMYNHLYLSKDPTEDINNIDDEWDYDTVLNASFDKSFDAGNSGFSLNNTDNVVIKRKELDSEKWITIFVKPIKKIEDFDIHFIDKYARSGVEYEYCVSSYVNGLENSYVIKNVFSEFDGYYIADKDCMYGTIYDLDGCDTSRNISAQVLNLLNSKYMSVVSNSSMDCDTGSISGDFIKIDGATKEVSQNGGVKLRNDVKARLANRKPLVLKIQDGRIWMIRVTGNPNDTQNGHMDLRTISFEWAEIGDINDMQDLYENNLSDVDSRWWY